MTKGLIVPFHRYPGMVSRNDLILYDYFVKKLDTWGKEFDTIYVVNSNGYLRDGETPAENAVIFNTENYSHAANLNHVFPYVKEDVVCIIDHDTLIYDNQISSYLDKADIFDIAAFIERPNDKEISRFAPYFFIGKRNAFPAKVDFSEAPPEHLDPLAKLTHEILQRNISYVEVPDDRSTIQLMKDGGIGKNPSVPNTETGIYHIRNFMGGLILVETYTTDMESFHQRFDPMPFEEVTRLLGWSWLMNGKTLESKEIYQTIMSIVNKQMGIGTLEWLRYMSEFEKYHNYV